MLHSPGHSTYILKTLDAIIYSYTWILVDLQYAEGDNAASSVYGELLAFHSTTRLFGARTIWVILTLGLTYPYIT